MYAFGTRETGRHRVALAGSVGIAADVVLPPRSLTSHGALDKRRGLPACVIVAHAAALAPPPEPRVGRATCPESPSVVALVFQKLDIGHGMQLRCRLAAPLGRDGRQRVHARPPLAHNCRVEPQARRWSSPETDHSELVGVGVDELHADRIAGRQASGGPQLAGVVVVAFGLVTSDRVTSPAGLKDRHG